jgi:hypothetical protein
MFTTISNIRRLLSYIPRNQKPDIYTRSGVYALTCHDRKRRYIDQTGRPLHIRYKEHAQDYKLNHKKSQFAKHLLEHNHSLDLIEESMSILHTTNKGKMLNTIEKFYIYKETDANNQLNDKSTVTPNIIFDTVIRNMAARGILY